MMIYAIFSTDRGSDGKRTMHAVDAESNARETICKAQIGRGSGLVRDGNYWNNRPCPTCWPATQRVGR